MLKHRGQANLAMLKRKVPDYSQKRKLGVWKAAFCSVYRDRNKASILSLGDQYHIRTYCELNHPFMENLWAVRCTEKKNTAYS